MPLRSFFSDDIFISYARKDSSTYASGLADELTKRGFSCFIDRLGTEANSELPGSLRRKIRSCALLVVVGTRWSGTRASIKDEIVEFKTTGRPIVPVDVDGSIYDAVWYTDIEGIAPEPEKNPQALDDGNPSPTVVSRIEKAFKYRRRNDRLRRWTIATAAILGLLIAVSVVAAGKAVSELKRAQKASSEAVTARDEAGKQTRIAEEAKIEAEKQTKIADDKTIEAREQTRIADLAKEEADKQTAIAKDKTAEAQKQTRLAAAARESARQATAEAKKQQGIAVGRQTVTTADSRRAQLQRDNQNWPELLQSGALLSIEAAKRLSSLGVQPAEADESLRNALDLLPRSVAHIETGHEVRNALLTPDGKYLLVLGGDNFLRVWETEAHRQVSPDIKLGRDLAFNADRKLAALVKEDGRLSVLELPRGGELWAAQEPADYSLLQFSPDGKYIAAGVVPPGKSGSADAAWKVVVWNARDGSRVAEIACKGDLRGLALSPDGKRLALSLTPRAEQVEDSNPAENLLQIWELKGTVATLVKETDVTAKEEPGESSVMPRYEPLTLLSFSPDGKLLAGSTGYHATVREVASGREVAYIEGPSRDPAQAVGNNIEEIVLVEFSPDGRTLGTIGDDGTMHTWDVFSGRRLWGHMGGAEDARGPYARLGGKGAFAIVDVRTGKDIARLLVSGEPLPGDYAPESALLALHRGKSVLLYDTGSAQEAGRVFLTEGGDVRPSNSSHDGRYVAVTTGTKVVVWDALNARVVASLDAGADVYYDVALSYDATHAAALSFDNKLHVWETRTERELWQFADEKITRVEDDERGWNVERLYFSPHGKFLVLEGGIDDNGASDIRVWDVSAGREVAKTTHSEAAGGVRIFEGEVAFTSDDRFVALQGGEAVRVLDTEDMTTVATLPQEEGAGPVVFSPDKRLMARSRRGMVEVLEIRSGRRVYEMALGGNRAEYRFSADGQFLAAFGGENMSDGQILEAASGDIVARIKLAGRADSFSFSHSRKYLLTVSGYGNQKEEVTVWEVAGGRRVAGHRADGIISKAVFSPDETRVAVIGYESPTVRLLNLKTKRVETELDNNGPVKNMTFSDDGRLLALTGGEWARVWEIVGGRELARLRHDRDVVSAKFVAGGRRLATVSEEPAARLWILPEDELIERACERLPQKQLSPVDWQRSFFDEKLRATCPDTRPAPDPVEAEEP